MPIVPGSDGLVKDAEDAIKIAREVRHHLLVSASIEMTEQISPIDHTRLLAELTSSMLKSNEGQ